MSNFGDILNQWEQSRQDSQSKAKKPALDDLYDAYAPRDTDIRDEDDTPSVPRKVSAVEASLDLHGFTAEDARKQVMSFLAACSRKGMRKVLIIHGKGYHSKNEPVLQRVVRECLEASPHAGKSGRPKRELGGSGAVWVMLK